MSELNDNIKRRAAALEDRLTRINNRLDRLITQIVSTSETSSTYWNSVNVEVRAIYEEGRVIAAAWGDDNLPVIYRDQIRRQITALKGRRFSTQGDLSYQTFVSTNSVKQSLAALLGEINTTWASGFNSGEKTLIRLTRLTQQYRVREAQIEKAIAQGFMEGGPGVRGGTVGAGSLYGVNRRLLQELTMKATNGQYITIIDKNGNPEQWDLKAYASMVARTKLAEASTQAVVNTTTAIGEDLVQVSAHNTTCAVCAEFEGKIYSLSGKDPDFPPADDLPPYHPNCAHRISTVIKEGLEADGTLQKYVEFSNGETDQHPTRSGWVPVSERELH
jgi:hypothetical protein